MSLQLIQHFPFYPYHHKDSPKSRHTQNDTTTTKSQSVQTPRDRAYASSIGRILAAVYNNDFSDTGNCLFRNLWQWLFDNSWKVLTCFISLFCIEQAQPILISNPNLPIVFLLQAYLTTYFVPATQAQIVVEWNRYKFSFIRMTSIIEIIKTKIAWIGTPHMMEEHRWFTYSTLSMWTFFNIILNFYISLMNITDRVTAEVNP